MSSAYQKLTTENKNKVNRHLIKICDLFLQHYPETLPIEILTALCYPMKFCEVFRIDPNVFAQQLINNQLGVEIDNDLWVIQLSIVLDELTAILRITKTVCVELTNIKEYFSEPLNKNEYQLSQDNVRRPKNSEWKEILPKVAGKKNMTELREVLNNHLSIYRKQPLDNPDTQRSERTLTEEQEKTINASLLKIAKHILVNHQQPLRYEEYISLCFPQHYCVDHNFSPDMLAQRYVEMALEKGVKHEKVLLDELSVILDQTKLIGKDYKLVQQQFSPRLITEEYTLCEFDQTRHVESQAGSENLGFKEEEMLSYLTAQSEFYKNPHFLNVIDLERAEDNVEEMLRNEIFGEINDDMLNWYENEAMEYIGQVKKIFGSAKFLLEKLIARDQIEQFKVMFILRLGYNIKQKNKINLDGVITDIKNYFGSYPEFLVLLYKYKLGKTASGLNNYVRALLVGWCSDIIDHQDAKTFKQFKKEIKSLFGSKENFLNQLNSYQKKLIEETYRVMSGARQEEADSSSYAASSSWSKPLLADRNKIIRITENLAQAILRSENNRNTSQPIIYLLAEKIVDEIKSRTHDKDYDRLALNFALVVLIAAQEKSMVEKYIEKMVAYGVRCDAQSYLLLDCITDESLNDNVGDLLEKCSYVKKPVCGEFNKIAFAQWFTPIENELPLLANGTCLDKTKSDSRRHNESVSSLRSPACEDLAAQLVQDDTALTPEEMDALWQAMAEDSRFNQKENVSPTRLGYTAMK